jgi:hypothetical protein
MKQCQQFPPGCALSFEMPKGFAMSQHDTDRLARLPNNLRAWLAEVGITNEEALQTALDTHPAFATSFQEHAAALLIEQHLTLFTAATTPETLRAFWLQVPRHLEHPFLDLVRAHIDELSQQSQTETATMLAERLASLEALIAETQQPPYVQALVSFLHADSDDAARAIFTTQRELLDTDQALQRLSQLAEQGDPNIQQRAALRTALLYELRSNTAGPAAETPDSELRGRLLASLATYNEAVRFSAPESAPLGYAAAQSSRAALLSELADLPGEDRHAHLQAALVAYNEALRFYSPEATPLTYAATQNNRAIALSALASIPGENRHEHLVAALAAYDAALSFLPPEHTSLAYAANQHNRAMILNALAHIPGEDQHERLQAALAASDQALSFYTAEADPAVHAMIQSNLLDIYRSLATLPSQESRVFIAKALRAGVTALTIFEQQQQASYIEQAQQQLRSLRNRFVEAFDDLWDALAIGPQPAWLQAEDPEITALLAQLDPILRGVATIARGNTQSREQVAHEIRDLETHGWMLVAPVGRIWAGDRNPIQLTAGLDERDSALVRQILKLIETPDMPIPGSATTAAASSTQLPFPPELQTRLAAAGVNDDASLQAALEQDPELAKLWLNYTLHQLIDAFFQITDVDALIAFWERVPGALEQPFLTSVRTAITRAEAANEATIAKGLRQRLDALELLLAEDPTEEESAGEQA